MEAKQNIKLEAMVMKCDACDWSYVGVERGDMGKWVNAACPKCGENLLTKDDYARSLVVVGLVDVFNGLSLDDIGKLSEPSGELEFPVKQKIVVNTHGVVSMEVKDVD